MSANLGNAHNANTDVHATGNTWLVSEEERDTHLGNAHTDVHTTANTM